jgi:hypothetical protein
VHQVGFAETHAAVDEQRVVRATGVLRDLESGRARELVALAFDEAVERERDVEPAADRRSGAHLGLDGRRNRRLTAHGGAAAYLDLDLRPALDVTPPPRANLLERVRLDPIDDEPVRRQQLQQRAVLDEL